MKKLLGVLAAGLLVFGVAGQAKATFATGDLIRVVYEPNANGSDGYEVATDLGNATNILNNVNGAFSTSNSLNLFSGTKFSSVNSDPTQLDVAYFATTGTGNAGKIFVSGTNGGTETNVISATNGYNTAAANLTALYNGATVTTTNGAWIAMSNQKSYYYTMDGNNDNTAGSFKGVLGSPPQDGEIALPANGSNVLQDIYYFATPLSGSTTISGSFTLETSVVNGIVTTTEVPAAAPIPPSVLLLGCGLLGLIGIRRRNIFNF